MKRKFKPGTCTKFGVPYAQTQNCYRIKINNRLLQHCAKQIQQCINHLSATLCPMVCTNISHSCFWQTNLDPKSTVSFLLFFFSLTWSGYRCHVVCVFVYNRTSMLREKLSILKPVVHLDIQIMVSSTSILSTSIKYHTGKERAF